MKLTGVSLNVVYAGKGVRFLFPGGVYTLRIEGTGIDVSAVGRGSIQMTGKGSKNDGTVAVNGATAVPLAVAPALATYGGTSGATVEKTTTEKSSGSGKS
jgi:hypothetical protein